MEKDYDLALRNYEKLREVYPDNDNLMFNTAILLRECGMYNESEGLLRRLYGLNSQFPMLRTQMAFVVLMQGNLPEASSLLQQAPPPGSPELPDYFRARAYLALAQHDTASALLFLGKALTAWPENPDTYLDLAQLQLLKGDTLQARRHREGAELFGASPARVAMLKALELEKRGAFRDALVLLAGTPRLNPLLQSSWHQLRIWLMAREGAWQEAREALAKLPPAHKNSADFKLMASAIRFMEGDWQGALDEVARIIEIYPDLGVAWLNKGVIYAHLNQMEEACACWKRAQELNAAMARVYLQFQCP